MATVRRLVCYPVKACAGTAVAGSAVTPAGLAHDRTFMATHPDGVFHSQRRRPRLALVRPVVLDGGARLALSAPGVEDFVLDVRLDGPRRAASVFTWQGTGVDQGADAAEWFAAVLGEPSRLLRVPPDHHRVSSGLVGGTAGFADGHAVHLTSQSSLDLLNERIAAAGGDPVPMNRFRPNVVVGGWDEPHTEDRVRALTAGGVGLAFERPCVRCPVPLVDQEVGRRSGHEPIRTLAGYRRDADRRVTFGIKAAVTSPGQLAVGDAVIVQTWAGERPNSAAADPPLTASASRPAESP
jgi:uncharacterized protein YcbX